MVGLAGNASRIIARIALAIAFAIAVAIPLAAFVFRGPDRAETWMVSAAALAVMTSIISAWSSRRVVELQEDAQRPNPYPSFDLASRHQLALLRVKNTGGTAAHDINLKWDIELKNRDGRTIGFVEEDGGITVLLPGESITQLIGVHHEFIKNHADEEYTGYIEFQDPVGTKYRRRFRLDGRQYAGTPSYDEETPRTQYQLQQIPRQLKELKEVIQRAVGP